MHITPTHGYQYLLDVLVQLACHVAMATMKEQHERTPADLQELMRALQHVDASGPPRKSSYISIYAPALIFVARHEPDLFPKPFARAIVQELSATKLWNIACDVDGLVVEGIDVARITDDEDYRWESLDDRTPNAMDLFIAPQVFSLILDAYEEQLK
jgi:hypothetical protein